MSAAQRLDDRLFVILMGFLAVGLQVLSVKLISPLLEAALPGFTKTGAHHVAITAVTLVVPAFFCLARTGDFTGRFADLRATLIWGGVFSLAAIALSVGIMEAASLIATGGLHMPGIAPPRTGLPVFVAVAIVGPIAEEALYRGFILKVLMERNSLAGAILATSLLAVIMHSVKYPRIEITYLSVKFLQSAILCLAYVKGRLGASSAVHVLNNTAAFILY